MYIMNDILARECNKDKTEMNGARASLLSRRAQESGECLLLEDLFICYFFLFLLFLLPLKFASVFSSGSQQTEPIYPNDQ